MLLATLFAAFCLVCSVLAFKRHPIYGLAFYMATTFVFPPGRWWGYLFGQTRWALLSAGLTALAIAFHRGKLKPKSIWFSNWPALIICAYAAWMWLQTPAALDVSEHIDGSIKYTKYLVAFWFIYRVADSKERVRDVLQIHVFGCMLLGVLAFMTGREGDRLDGVGGPGIDDANTLGMYLVTGAMVAAGLFLTQRGWRRWLNLAAFVIVANGLVLTNSRGAVLAFVAGMLALLLVKARRHRRIYWAFALSGAVGLVFVVDDAFIRRMYTIEDVTSKNDEADMSARSRVEVANAQIQMFLDHPMGTGHRGTVVLSPLYLDPKWLTTASGDDTAARASHNSFLTALVEQGFLGALLFGSMNSRAARSLPLRMKRTRPSKRARPAAIRDRNESSSPAERSARRWR